MYFSSAYFAHHVILDLIGLNTNKQKTHCMFQAVVMQAENSFH